MEKAGELEPWGKSDGHAITSPDPDRRQPSRRLCCCSSNLAAGKARHRH
jgi:hypothetical protein